MENMEQYNKLRQPPATALRPITGGRLSGKTDINPQWRYEIMTKTYGPCGAGWKYAIDKLWTEQGNGGVVCVFATVNLQIKQGDEWSQIIPGIGGNQLIVKERNGLYVNDEAYKMAVTDALSVAMKMLGVGADIYAGLWDGSNYASSPAPYKDMLHKFKVAKETLKKESESNEIYYTALKSIGVEHANQIKNISDGNRLLEEFRTFLRSPN